MPGSTLTPLSNTYYFPVAFGPFSFGGTLAGTPASDTNLQGDRVTAISADGLTFTPVPTDGSRVTVTGRYSTFSADYLGHDGNAPIDTGDNNQGLIDAIQANEGNGTPLMDTFYYQVTDDNGSTVTDQFTYQYGDVNFARNGDPANGGSEVFGGSAETVAPGSTTAIPGLSITKAMATGQTQQDIDNTPLTVTISAFDFATQQADGSIAFDPTKEGAGAGGTFTTTDGGYVIQGTLAQINADLQGLTYTAPTSGPSDDFILIQATDGPTPTAGYVEGEIKATGTTPPPQPPPQDTFQSSFQIRSGGGGQSGNLPNTSGYTITGISLDGQNFTPVTSSDSSFATSATLTGTYLTFAVNADGTALESDSSNVQTTVDAIHANEGNATALGDTLYYQLTDGNTTFIDAVKFNLNDVQFNQTGTPYNMPETVQQGTATLVPGMSVDTLVPTGETSDANEHLVVQLGVFDFTRQSSDGTLSIDLTHVGAGGNTGETITYDPTSPFAMLTIDGTVAQINADLQGLTYNSPNGTGDDFITIQAIEGPATTPDFVVGEVKTACYAAGTLILTDKGEVAVETLAAGDHVVTASGARRPIVWIGRRGIDLDRHPRPEAVRPVRVAAGALGHGLPVRDLLLSPEHALWLEGALVPAERLINGATIRQEAWSRVDYVHVELETHDILLAEGVPAESYLDCDNRHDFENAPDGVVALHADWRDASAGRVFASPSLSRRLRARFAERAVALGRWAEIERFDAEARGRRGLTRTNVVRNPRGEGAVVGRLGEDGRAPTGWWIATPADLAVEIVRSGDDDGLPFVDLRLSGRAAAGGQIHLYPEPGSIPAEAGQDWTTSCHSRLVEGALDAVETLSLYVDEYAEDGRYIAGGAVAQALPTADDLHLQRLVATRRLRAPGVRGTTGYLQIAVRAGATLDVTLRLAGLQIEQGGYASDLMLPPPGRIEATTRIASPTPAPQDAARRVA